MKKTVTTVFVTLFLTLCVAGWAGAFDIEKLILDAHSGPVTGFEKLGTGINDYNNIQGSLELKLNLWETRFGSLGVDLRPAYAFNQDVRVVTGDVELWARPFNKRWFEPYIRYTKDFDVRNATDIDYGNPESIWFGLRMRFIDK